MKQESIIILVLLLLTGCNEYDDLGIPIGINLDYELDLPDHFPPMDIPSDNPLTVNGVALGRMLFYDPMLSKDGTQSCASCHNQEYAFTDDGLDFSVGITGAIGEKNAMALINLGYSNGFFWDGRSATLEEQVQEPVENPIEMHDSWPNVIRKLKQTSNYPLLFRDAFGEDVVTRENAAKAIAQFIRTLVSSNSKYDKFVQNDPDGAFTQDEFLGRNIFFSEVGDCFHCHGTPLLTTQEYRNNGLDSTFNNPNNTGLFAVTGDSNDLGKFKGPTLRNIGLTAPYMHDSRFKTLEEVVDHYSDNLRKSDYMDPILDKPTRRPLTQDEKTALVAFLHTLTDTTFTNNPAFSDPFAETD